jgi:hypothetical protein
VALHALILFLLLFPVFASDTVQDANTGKRSRKRMSACSATDAAAPRHRRPSGTASGMPMGGR